MKKNLIFAVAAFGLFAGILEGGMRLYFFAGEAVSPPPLQLEAELGWAPPAHSKSVSRPKGFGDVAVVTTKRDGFRVFGDPAASRKKIWVIGDSFTQAAQVSDGKGYYDFIAVEAGYELFAFGCGGYGTLQEFMVLDRFLDEIRPDLILWQFSGNDLINNDHELESRSRINNNRNVRPYWVDGRIRRLYPKSMGAFPSELTRISVLARFVAVQWNLAFPARGTVEETLGSDHPMLKRSESVTAELMRKVKERAGSVPVVAFLADDGWSIGDGNFDRIAADAGIVYISGVPDAVRAARDRGFKVDGSPYDSHWSAIGHRVVGEYLFKRLSELTAAGIGKETE